MWALLQKMQVRNVVKRKDAQPFMLPSNTILTLTHFTHMEIANHVCLTDWTQEEAEVPGDNTHLWEESWDDDDTSEDFSAQLKFVISPSPCLEDLV
jgi:hypothetical protein